MTTNSIADIRSYSIQSGDRFFFDANVWLCLWGPAVSSKRRSNAYSRAMCDIRVAGCPIFLDALVMSEFINAFARLEWYRSVSASGKFKDFRKSPDFKPVANDIALNAKRIAMFCSACESEFTSVDIASLLNDFALGDSDFNDQMIAEICRKNGFALVTDDADFAGSGLNILTANRGLLAS